MFNYEHTGRESSGIDRQDTNLFGWRKIGNTNRDKHDAPSRRGDKKET